MCSSESSERMEPSLWNFKGFEYRMKAAPQHIGLSEGLPTAFRKFKPAFRSTTKSLNIATSLAKTQS